MGKLGDIFDIFVESGRELSEIMEQGRQELTEIATTGFKEMVIEDKSDFKTSYEREDEANQKISEARRVYEEARTRLGQKLEHTNQVLQDLGRFMLQIEEQTVAAWLKAVGPFRQTADGKVTPRLERTYDFLDYEHWDQMERRAINSVNILGKSATDGALGGVVFVAVGMGTIGRKLAAPSFSTAGLVGLPAIVRPPDTGLGFEILKEHDWSRIERAQKYLNEADEYARKVKTHASAMEQSVATLELVEKKAGEATKVLQILESALQNDMPVLKALRPGPLTQAQSNLIERSRHLVAAINQVISTPLLSEEGFPNEATKNLYQEIYRLVETVSA